MSDHIFDKAREFTDTENLALEAWLIADGVGRYALAFQLLDTGLMFEHYRSLLAADPAEFTEKERAQLDTLRTAFQASLDVFNADKKVQLAKRYRALVERLRRRLST